jgi:hypothetical protein
LNITRAIVDAAPTAHWLLEPTIGAERRIKRSIMYRLKSANELAGAKHHEPWMASARKTQQACHEFMAGHRWIWKSNSLDGEVYPQGGDFTEVTFGAKDAALDEATWKYLSACMHGHWYAVAQAVQMLPETVHPSSSLDPQGRLAAIVVSGESITMFALLAFLALEAANRARFQLMGWAATDELAAARRAMAPFVAEYADRVRQSGPNPLA